MEVFRLVKLSDKHKNNISIAKTKHKGRTVYTKEYNTWKAMRNRCNNPNYHAYHRYGGRGIKVCERWNDFNNFIEDMGPKPLIDAQIDRVDNDGHYTPHNCVWVTPKENCNNRKNYRSKSEYTGVHFREQKQKYEVNICINRKVKYLGSFINLEDAVNARKKFAIDYNNKYNTNLKYENFVK